MQITKNQLSAYNLQKTIGRGTFGKVKLATHRITGESVAIKILEKNKLKDLTDVERVSRQLHILKTTQHASIAQLYEIIENDTTIFIVMEYAPYGQFFDYIMDEKIVSQQEVNYYLMQIVQALEYLHKLKICHRDVKPQNMLLDYKRRLKIVDFGLSNMYKKDEFLLTACGSPCYASPEMIKGEHYDPQLTDVWSLGVVLYSMIMAKLPFQDDNTSVLYGKIKSGLYIIDKKISPQLKDLLSKMLSVDPTKRFNLEAIKNHSWFKKQKMIKLSGIRVGFQNLAFDEEILSEMDKLGYNIHLARRYLENNIRNNITAAYYLLLKRNFCQGKPSRFDINNQHFERKFLLPKMNLINQEKKRQPNRHKSFDCCLTMKDFQRFDDKSSQRRQRRKQVVSQIKKQKKYYSQMKSYQFEKQSKMKNHLLYANRNNYISSSMSRNNRNQINHRYASPTCSKKSQKSIKSIDKKSLSKNLQKQQNISINVFINNAKIQTNSRKNSKKKINKQNLKFEKQLGNLSRGPDYYSQIKRRLKTEGIDRESPKPSIQSTYKPISKRFEKINLDKNMKITVGINESKNQNRNQRTSHKVDLLESDTFWKKRSTNTNHKQYTTQTRGDHSKSRYRYG